MNIDSAIKTAFTIAIIQEIMDRGFSREDMINAYAELLIKEKRKKKRSKKWIKK